jgi:hypothetical protein
MLPALRIYMGETHIMRRLIFGSCLLVLGLCSFALAQPAPPGDAKRIGELIADLGSTVFQKRVAAQKELEGVGPPALEQLKKSVQTSDLETSRRARDLIRRIEENKITTELLAPRHVQLKITDIPVSEAVGLLAKQSGYVIQIVDNRATLANRKITLDTGDVSFWEALDNLCREAGLVERDRPPGGEGSILSDRVLPGTLIFKPQYVRMTEPTGIALVAGPRYKLHSSLARSVRVRLFQVPGSGAEDYRLLLEATPEPRLQGFTILSTHLSKALDDQGQERVLKNETIPEMAQRRLMPMAQRRQVPLGFEAGVRPAKSLEKLTGSVTAQVMHTTVPVTIIIPFTFDNVPLE